MRSRDPGIFFDTRIQVWIRAYHDESEMSKLTWDESARENAWEWTMGDVELPGVIIINNDNNTDAALDDMRTFSAVSEEGVVIGNLPFPIIPLSDRMSWSVIRIGHVRITLMEQRPWYDINNDYSSQFIELIVEMLQEAD